MIVGGESRHTCELFKVGPAIGWLFEIPCPAQPGRPSTAVAAALGQFVEPTACNKVAVGEHLRQVTHSPQLETFQITAAIGARRLRGHRCRGWEAKGA